jgi:hypothetical protein
MTVQAQPSKLSELISNLSDAFWFALGLAIAVGLLRMMSWVVHRFRFRTGVPLVFHTLSAADQQQVKDAKLFAGDDLVPKLMAYVAEDPPGTLVPGGLGTSGPVTAAEEAGEKGDWAAMLLALAVARRPGYHVQLSVVDAEDSDEEQDEKEEKRAKGRRKAPGPDRMTKVTVTIFRQPGGRIVASTTIEKTWKELISHIGAFCIYQVGSQRAVQRRTPRWEQWHSADAYRHYREGLTSRRLALESQLKAIQVTSQMEEARRGNFDDGEPISQDALRTMEAERSAAMKEFKRHLAAAADSFALAGRMDPANLLPALAQAAILELSKTSSQALPLYKACREQWQEQVEIAYRIAAHDPRHDKSIALLRQQDVLHWLRDSQRNTVMVLDRWQIARMWLRTWLPVHWAPGERRYWFSWFKPEHPRAPWISLRTKRREYLTATSAVLIAAAMWKVAETSETLEGLAADADNDQQRAVVGRLFVELDLVLNDGGGRDSDDSLHRVPVYSALLRLFHPDPSQQRKRRPEIAEKDIPKRHVHDGLPMGEALPPTGTPHGTRVRPAKRIGWLAHFNAACCFSLAMGLPAAIRPWRCDDPTWREDCCRAALRELTKVLRHPYSQLDTSWLWYDPDLDPLKLELKKRSEVNTDDPLSQLAKRIGLPSWVDGEQDVVAL